MRILLACMTGFGLDLIFGDPYWLYHPIRLIGHLISFLEKPLRSAAGKSPKKQIVAGGILWLLVILISTGIPCLICVCITSVPSSASSLHLPVPASAPWSRAASVHFSVSARTETSPAPLPAPALPAVIWGKSETLPSQPSFPEHLLLQSMRDFQYVCRQIEPVFLFIWEIILPLANCGWWRMYFCVHKGKRLRKKNL